MQLDPIHHDAEAPPFEQVRARSQPGSPSGDLPAAPGCRPSGPWPASSAWPSTPWPGLQGARGRRPGRHRGPARHLRARRRPPAPPCDEVAAAYVQACRRQGLTRAEALRLVEAGWTREVCRLRRRGRRRRDRRTPALAGCGVARRARGAPRGDPRGRAATRHGGGHAPDRGTRHRHGRRARVDPRHRRASGGEVAPGALALADLGAHAPRVPDRCATNGVATEAAALRQFGRDVRPVRDAALHPPGPRRGRGQVQPDARRSSTSAASPAGPTRSRPLVAADLRAAGFESEERADIMAWKRRKLVAEHRQRRRRLVRPGRRGGRAGRACRGRGRAGAGDDRRLTRLRRGRQGQGEARSCSGVPISQPRAGPRGRACSAAPATPRSTTSPARSCCRVASTASRRRPTRPIVAATRGLTRQRRRAAAAWTPRPPSPRFPRSTHEGPPPQLGDGPSIKRASALGARRPRRAPRPSASASASVVSRPEPRWPRPAPRSASVSTTSVSSTAGSSTTGAAAAAVFFDEAAFGLYASVTSSMTAIGALSPLRGPILVIRV